MQGINKARHFHVINAMLELEKLAMDLELDHGDIFTLNAKRNELEECYQLYLKMLGQIELQIADYEDLFAEIKVRFTSSRVKKLKKCDQQKSQI